MSDQQASHGNSPAPASLTPMDLDVNAAAATTDQQQHQQLHPTPASAPTDFHNTGQVPSSFPLNPNMQAESMLQQPPMYPHNPAAMERLEHGPQGDSDLNKREKTLAEFLAMMDSYTPIIPDAVTDYYLSRTGFDCDDVRIKRLLALAAQKFVADIATDAYQYCKVRQSGSRKTGKDRRAVLTMEDLSAALAEYGINVKKPDYYT